MIGRKLSHYEITAKLGEGGMGEVWRATDTKLRRDVAIKVLPEAFTEDPDRLSRFEREAQLLAQLQHPNIASIFGIEDADGVRALVMELVEGPTLADRLQQGPLPLEDALDLARQICEALEDAHEKGIVHRDLKPQNVKASPEGAVKVLDFGLAKALDPTARQVSDSASQLANSPTITLGATVQGVILGTAAYMSPEQAKGLAVDRRADIWSFGVVLHEMLTGTRLFAADTMPETLAGVISREIDLDALPPSVPPAIRRLLHRCLERRPKRRLHSIADARIVLEEVLEGHVEETAPVDTPNQRGISWTVAIPALLLTAVAGVFAGHSLSPESAPPESIRVQRLTTSGRDSQPCASPDGRFVAFSSSRDGVPRIWLKQMEGGGEQPLTEGPDFLPRFTPDGSGVGFLRRRTVDHSDLYRTALVGEPKKLLEDLASFDWSPDGRAVVFVRNRRQVDQVDQAILAILDLETRKERQLLQLEGWLLTEPRWSPDGRQIAVTRGGAIGAAGGWKILLVDVASGATQDVVTGQGLGMLSGGAWNADGEGLYYAASSDNVGDLTGRPSQVRYVIPGSAPQTLLWASGLFPFRGSASSTAALSQLGPRSLVFDTWEQRQSLFEVDLVSGEERTITEGLAADRQPAYSPDGRFIVFSSNRTGNLDLWLLERASGRLRQLTDDPAPDWDPGFTPDGTRILFSSGRGGSLEIWSIAADGSDARQISHDGVDAENPTMTPGGRWIVYTSGNPDHLGLFRIRPDGTEAKRLTEGNHTNGEISPDGRWALYVSFQNLGGLLKFVEIETGRAASASMIIAATDEYEPSVTLGRARWLPGGRAVAFVGLDEEGRTGIFQQDFDPERDTTPTRRKLAGFFEHRKTESFGISPDGSKITLALVRETRVLTVAEGLPK